MTDHESHDWAQFLPPERAGRQPAPAPPPGAPDRTVALEAAAALEEVLHETKRVIVGQDAMLERVLVALLAGGHVLLEGVPGLAKTLTVKTLAQVLGGTFSRVQFTPDLVPADLVGTRVWRPDTGTFDTELGPVFGNLLLADEINRAPAKVQSALLEVMQEHQVTIGGQTFPVPEPFIVLATQNPIESEGTYPLPEAQVDRFLLKILVDYPSVADESAVVTRVLAGEPEVREVIDTETLLRHRETVRAVAVDRADTAYAVALADATRNPASYGLGDLDGRIEVGASPRGPIGLVQSAQALALLRGRGYVTSRDIRDVAPDVLRHRLVLSYEAHADGITPDAILDRVLDAVEAPALRREGAA
jgi:MoxR-like ATPase